MMNHLAAPLIGLALLGSFAGAQEVQIRRSAYGSGEPGKSGFENAVPVDGKVYHAPQYLPGSPTAASLWARVVQVRCISVAPQGMHCEGYQWTPELGRAEYLFFTPITSSGPAQ
jgi:hypothetical protein